MRCAAQGADRRKFFGLLGLGLAVALTGCVSSEGVVSAPPPKPPPQPLPTPEWPPAVPAARPGDPVQIERAPSGTRRIALTIDDGYCRECVAGYAAFAVRSRIHLTFCPNGTYAPVWEPCVDQLKPLVERGQVQIMNHTFNHPDLRQLSDAKIEAEFDRNDEWVIKTFGVTTRPYYRPPFGYHDDRVNGVAAGLGYTHNVLWNGSFGDDYLVTPEYLLSQADRYLKPGTIMLGHANHPTIVGLFDEITDMIRQRDLTPVTLDEMFGTSRATG
jgi:peptidoglycan-N-acetylglucosamine deacetylase